MVTWDPYLASIRDTYAQWWHVYTLTDVEDRKRKEQQQTPGLFDFGLMVQTKSEQPERDQNREETERLPVLEGLRKYATDHVLLMGRPGSGKSTALVRLLGDDGIQGKIPVLVELRYHQTSVLELVKDFLESHLGQPLDSKEIERLLFDRQFLLLIDGVNELPSEAARLDLTKFRQKYQKTTPMIFTTRNLGVGGDLGIEKKLEMQPLSAAQMSEFVRKYLPQQGEQMLTQLGDRLRELGETPLLLMMLCSLFQNKGEIPSNLGLVFRSFTQFYSEKIKADVNVSDNNSREFWPDLLQQLGFVMTTGDNPKEITVAVPKTKAQEILTDYLRQKDFIDPDVRARAWLKDLLNHHLLQQSGELIEFRHQLIQEYYTAEYLLKQLPRLSDQELQQNYLNYLKWTEPLVLMLQLVDHEAQAERVVRLGLTVDWQLGARLAGAVKPEFQEQTVGLVAGLEVPKLLKVELLGITGSENAIPELTKCLDNNHEYVRIIAADALGKIGTEASIDLLIKLLDDDHHSVHRSAAYALGKIGIEATIDPLIKCLDDDHYNVRIIAADALGQIGTEATINPLIKLLDDDHYNVRSSAAFALEQIGTEAAINPFIKLLDDDHYNVRSSAAFALEQIGKEAAINPLIKLLDDDSYDVRSSAAFALENIGTEAAINPLIKLLDDDSYDVRSSAAFALGQIGTEAAINPLIKLLDDDSYDVRIIAADALGQIGTEATIDLLIKLLDDDHYNVRIIAAYALEKIGTEVAIYPLIKLLDDDSSDVRKSAAYALGKIGTEATIDPLIKLLDDDHYNVPSGAAEALGKIGTEATIHKLMNLLKKKEFAATDNKDIFQNTINALKTIQERYQVYNPTYLPKPTPKPDPPKFIAIQTIYILHLSDLHITTPEQATLWSNQLAQDLTQDLQIPHLDALILSGDIANYSTPQEYQAAQQFLDNFCQDFPLDPKQIVLVPGNHDLNWKLSKDAYEFLYRENYNGELKEGHYIEVNEELIGVRDEAKYQQRFAHFSQFYQAIKTEPYPLDYDQQGIIHHLPEQNLLILGLNSAWQLDHHFKDRASIHPGALSKALTQIRRNKDYGNCLKIAVWHHPLNSDGSDRITDQGFMEQLAVAEFRLFLHGHIHKAQASVFPYDLSRDGRKLHGICAGTFSAPTFELRSAYPWQYNLLKINDNQLTVSTRRREEENGAWKPDARWGQGAGKSALDYYSIEL
ncbi:MAG: NACHT domain-containing protein [Moorea sp. SIO2I5]|nr:NACHT domain-containing protein [Moorena sp. SIO2I5]